MTMACALLSQCCERHQLTSKSSLWVILDRFIFISYYIFPMNLMGF